MFRIYVRNKVRRMLHARIDAKPRERAYLDEFPWLEQVIPLGKMLPSDAIKVKKLDAAAIEKVKDPNNCYAPDKIYIFDGAGNILAVLPTLFRPHPICPGMDYLINDFRKTKPEFVVDRTVYIVTTAVRYAGRISSATACWITLYKLSKDTRASDYLRRVMDDYAAIVRRSEEQTREQQETEYATAREKARSSHVL